MGFLLVHHELLRAKAKVNHLTLDQSKFQRKKTNIEKAIQKKESFYNKKATALKQTFSNMKSQLTNAINGGNYAAVSSSLGISSLVTDFFNTRTAEYNGSNISSIFDITDIKGLTRDEKTGEYYQVDKDGNRKGEALSKEDVKSAQWAQFQYQQQMMAQLKAQYSSMVDQYLQAMQEAAEQALDDEKDLAMLPLQEEDTEMDNKIATNDLQLREADQYVKSLEEREKSQVQDSVPKFGLG